jgi:hypothetical protein
VPKGTSVGLVKSLSAVLPIGDSGQPYIPLNPTDKRAVMSAVAVAANQSLTFITC